MLIKDFDKEMRDTIVDAVKTSLQKIGINVDVNLTISKVGEKLKFTVETEKFNSVPVIYKHIIISGKSELEPVEGHEGVYDLNFYLDYRFETFRGGNNGTGLGLAKFRVLEDASFDRVRFLGFVI